MMQASRRHRRRLPRSCEECRRRKVKCDRDHPCSHCVLTKCRCLYNTGPHLSAPRRPAQPRREASSLESHLPSRSAVDRGSELNLSSHRRSGVSDTSTVLLGSTVAERDSANRLFPHPLRSSQAGSSEVTSSTVRTPSPEPLFVRDNRKASGARVGPSLIQSIIPSSPKEHHAKPDRPLVLNKSRLFGRTHWTNSVYEFQKIAAFLRSETTISAEQETLSPLKAETQTLLQQCKHLSQNVKPLRPGRFLPCLEPIVSAPDMADHLIQLYLSNIEAAFRILHRPSFKKEYEKYKVAPASVADVTVLKIQLAIAIGSGLSQELANAKEVRKTACQWLYAAQTWLSGPMEKDRLSIDGIQVHCLLILARQVLAVSHDLSWVAMGMLVRTALQMGLHRDPRHFTRMSVFEAEMRKRIWATILELNAQASLDSGTPPGISYDEFDTGPPANLNDEDISEDSTSLRQRDETTKTDTSLQRFLLENLPPRMEMLRRMNGLNVGLEDERVLALSAKFSVACRAVDSHVQGDLNDETTIFQQNMATLLLRRFLLVLHRPLAGRIRENALYYHSRKVSFDTAMALLKPSSPNRIFTYLMLRGGGLFKSCITHASLALGSELLIEIEEEGSDTYKRMLVDAVKEARQLWVERIKLGDTNVRLHMKLCVVLSQAEVVGDEGAQMQQQRMAQSAKDSLQLCYCLIRENIGSIPNTISSESDDWSGQSLPLERNTENLSLSNHPFNFEDILHLNGAEMDGSFGSHIALL
ncbi:hypothetical protein F5Y03DRAFT_105846 [Xylaria venustula]|nr:hypothetical protein F5Y03DRAFT_105846 [Xylaria venustula]